MHWSDRGLVLGTRLHGEAAILLEVMSRAHGRHLGLVHGGRSRRLRPALQPGNALGIEWRARLDEQLGTFTVEPDAMRAATLMAAPAALFGVATLAAHLRLLPERDPHPALFDAADALVAAFAEDGAAPEGLVLFELRLLAELGFGLDLGRCGATGTQDDLLFVSPRTGRAVSRAAGEPWRDRLLSLPAFLGGAGEGRSRSDDLRAGFALTEHFLRRSAWEPRRAEPPHERARLVALLTGPD